MVIIVIKPYLTKSLNWNDTCSWDTGIIVYRGDVRYLETTRDSKY